jgi:pimeloyl-ACP methyl ester carboxylesterase
MSATILHQRCVTVNGVSVPILAGGLESSDEAVVFVRGNPGSGRDWEVLAGAVSKFARSIAPDLPGFGRADKPVDFPTRAGFQLLLKHGNPRGLPREFVDRMYDGDDAGTRRAILKLYRSTDRPDDGAMLVDL